MSGSALTPKQQRFVEEYLVDLNATQAAIRAGYSPDTAKSIGHENLTKPDIQSAIARAREEQSKRTAITADMVLAELARVGFSNMKNYARWNPDGVTLEDSENLTDDAARCVAEVSQTVTAEGGTVKFKLHDKVGALERIGRHLGMFPTKVEMSGKDGGPIEVYALTPAERTARITELLESARARRAGRPADGSDEMGAASGSTDTGADE